MDIEKNKIKIAIIGFGKMGRIHYKALCELRNGEFETYYKGDFKEVLSRIDICGICDISSKRSDDLHDIPFYSNHMSLINETRPDVVIISTPTDTHYQIAKDALENGVNAFIEKPIVEKLEEFQLLRQLAKENGLMITAGYVERYNPVSLKLREILKDYTFENKHFFFSRIQPHDDRIKDDIIVDKLIHDLDLAQYLFGDIKDYEIIDFKTVSGKVFELEINLRHDYGEGKIFVSWLKGNEILRELKLEQKRQSIIGDFLNKTLKVNNVYINCNVPHWVDLQNNQVKDELVDFIISQFSNLTNLPAPLITIDEIESTVAIIEEISLALNYE